MEFLPTYVGQQTIGVVQTYLEKFGFEIFQSSTSPHVQSFKENVLR